MGIVSEYIRNLIAKHVDDNGIVVWYDPDVAYSQAVEALDLPDTSVLCYEGSFIRLRWEIDNEGGWGRPLNYEFLPELSSEKLYARLGLAPFRIGSDKPKIT